jgi:hypothetical protein
MYMLCRVPLNCGAIHANALHARTRACGIADPAAVWEIVALQSVVSVSRVVGPEPNEVPTLPLCYLVVAWSHLALYIPVNG